MISTFVSKLKGVFSNYTLGLSEQQESVRQLTQGLSYFIN